MVDRLAVKSANRVLDLFELLGRWGGELSHTEIAAALKIPKSSLSQLLPNLVDRGYVQFVAENKGYRLGPKLISLVTKLDQEQSLEALVRPILETITEQTGESSSLNVLQGDASKVVATVNSPQRLVSHMRTGDLAPLHTTSGGKAILAFLSEPMREDYMARVTLKEITENTITSMAELRRQIDAVRRDRIAFANGEFTSGITGMAVPILNQTSDVVGSINVAMPSVRYNSKVRDKVAMVLEKTVHDIRQQLGFAAPPVRKARAKRTQMARE
jgi:DNA-binding IclR family transcriptional regulator